MRAIIYFLLDGREECIEVYAFPNDTQDSLKVFFDSILLLSPDICEFIGAEIWRG